MAKEEQVLFPMILAGAGPRTRGPITVMLHEHDDHGANLAKMRQLAGDFQPPEAACTTWRALYLRLEELEGELMDHIALENNVLFPKALRPERAAG
jgi:regulator of cell morphogenesis and NO signaling